MLPRERFPPELICGLTAIPTEFPGRLLFLKGIDKLTLKYLRKFRTPRVAKHNFEENKPGGTVQPDFKFPYKATVIRIVGGWPGGGGLEINAAELELQKYTFTFTVSEFETTGPRQFDRGEMRVISTSGATTTRYSY